MLSRPTWIEGFEYKIDKLKIDKLKIDKLMTRPITTLAPRHRRERGQTLLLVAVSMVSLLAMAALAIDVVTLYTARNEIQRAADNAALAGAKAFVDSGVTTTPADTTRQGLAQSMATSIITALLAQNKVGGSPPVLVGTPAFDFASHPGNPKVTVTLRRTGLPIFFARIWSSALATVSATAMAEAYNPSESQTNTGNLVPIQPKCVKPFLVANIDPGTGGRFVDSATGEVLATSAIGESFTLNNRCPAGGSCSSILPPAARDYYPAKLNNIPNPANLCPACQGVSVFEQSIECCDANAYSCGGAATANVDITITTVQANQDTSNGLQCLIHKPPQDSLDPTNVISFAAGTAPLEIRANSGPQSGHLVSTSNSIVTIPLIDAGLLPTNPAAPAPVVGFLQAFVNEEGVDAGAPGNIAITILNVAGCGNSPAGSTVAGGGVTPIPVRLIH